MKPARQWAEENFSFGADTKEDIIELIRAIQNDAQLDLAAENGDALMELERVTAGHKATIWSLMTLQTKIRDEIDWLESRRNHGEVTTLGMVQDGLRAMLTKPAAIPSPADSP